MVAAKGKANIGGITVGAKNVKVVLEISKRDFFKNAKFFESDPEEVDFVLGDMQMSISDYLASAAPHQGLKATVDSSGVVQAIEGDGNQAQLFGPQPAEEIAPPNPDMELSFEEGSEPDSAEQGGEEQDPEGQAAEGDASDESADDVQDEGKSDTEPDSDVLDEGPEPSKEEVEDHILKHKPRFDDVSFDPELLEFKKQSGKTWMEIAQQYGVSSGKLQGDYAEYKKRVIKAMKKNGAA